MANDAPGVDASYNTCLLHITAFWLGLPKGHFYLLGFVNFGSAIRATQSCVAYVFQPPVCCAGLRTPTHSQNTRYETSQNIHHSFPKDAETHTVCSSFDTEL